MICSFSLLCLLASNGRDYHHDSPSRRDPIVTRSIRIEDADSARSVPSFLHPNALDSAARSRKRAAEVRAAPSRNSRTTTSGRRSNKTGGRPPGLSGRRRRELARNLSKSACKWQLGPNDASFMDCHLRALLLRERSSGESGVSNSHREPSI